MSDDGFPESAAGPVRYERVYRGNTVIGYLWCSAAGLENGAGFVPRPDAGDAGAAAHAEWSRRVGSARAATDVIADWRRHPEDRAGALNDTGEWEAATVAELVRLAAEPEREERHAKDRPRSAPREDAVSHEPNPGQDTYAPTTDGPVRYAPAVSGDGTVLGYLWASPEEDAAGFVERAAAGTVNATNAAAVWRRRLGRAHDRGLPAIGALREWIGEDPAAGHTPDPTDASGTTSPEWRLAGALPPSSERAATSLRELRRLAGDPRAGL